MEGKFALVCDFLGRQSFADLRDKFYGQQFLAAEKTLTWYHPQGHSFPTIFCANVWTFSNWSQDRLANVSLKFCCTNLTILGMQSWAYLRTNQLPLHGFSRVWCVWNRNRRFEKVVSWIAHLNIMLNHQPAFLPLPVQNHDDDYGGGGKSCLLPKHTPDDVDDGCDGLGMHTIWQF